jgi:hypothetical protein
MPGDKSIMVADDVKVGVDSYLGPYPVIFI